LLFWDKVSTGKSKTDQKEQKDDCNVAIMGKNGYNKNMYFLNFVEEYWNVKPEYQDWHNVGF
jgi:hypothetical protein